MFTLVKRITDDLTGEVLPDGAGETVKFALDGVAWEVDLSDEHAAEFRKVMERYQHRKVGRADLPATASRSGRRRTGVTSPGAAAMRRWAEEAGLIPPGRRGRIPAEVREAYEAHLTGVTTEQTGKKATARKGAPRKATAAA